MSLTVTEADKLQEPIRGLLHTLEQKDTEFNKARDDMLAATSAVDFRYYSILVGEDRICFATEAGANQFMDECRVLCEGRLPRDLVVMTRDFSVGGRLALDRTIFHLTKDQTAAIQRAKTMVRTSFEAKSNGVVVDVRDRDTNKRYRLGFYYPDTAQAFHSCIHEHGNVSQGGCRIDTNYGVPIRDIISGKANAIRESDTQPFADAKSAVLEIARKAGQKAKDKHANRKQNKNKQNVACADDSDE